MNESALNALINLFAVFSIKGDLEYEKGRESLEGYLKQRLGIRNTGEYISLFFEIHELYSLSPKLLTDEKIHNLIHQICSRLKGKIPQSEQIIVFLRFLELASDYNIDIEDQYYRQVGEIFEIGEEDYTYYKSFISCKNPSEINTKGFLTISNKESVPDSPVLHIQEESLKGEILVFYIDEIKQFVFKLFGPDVLLLEGVSIREGHFYTLNQGSIIRGHFKTSIYYSDISLKYFNYQQAHPLLFSAYDVDYFFPGSKNGVQRFRFSESSGQLIAVMGGSGVGKSTLLNVLNGSLPPSSGKITINGFDIHKDFSRIEGLIGYIPQDDLVIGELTVFQNVYHNARLCLDQLSSEEISEKVNKLLFDLDLFEIKDMVVGSPLKKTLSGGQRKRLNIALELIREPSVLFVDEPTSGLSSRDSEKIMILLKEQARQGRLVIVNIHQPSSFIYKLFDKLWILDKGGHMVYAGNPIDAVIYFKELANHIDSDSCECPQCGNVNPEQVLDIIESIKIDASGKPTEERLFTPEELNSLYNENIQDSVEIKPDPVKKDLELNFHKPSRFKQFKIFLTRNIQSKLSNRQYIIINLLQAPLLALVVSLLTRYVGDEGYLFGDNKNFPSFIFMAVVVMLFQGMSLSAEEIIRDRALLQRESFLRLSRFSYINSKIIFLVFVSAIQSMLFVLTSFLILGIPGLLFQYWLILFLTAVFANLSGLIISAGLNSVVTIYISIPLLIIPQILLSGLIVPFEDLQAKNARNDNVPVVGDFMVSRWAFEALTVNQFVNNKYTVNYFDLEKELAGYRINKFITEELGDMAQSARFELGTDGDKDKAKRLLSVIRRELLKLDSDDLTAPFPQSWLVEENYDARVNDSLQSHLRTLKNLNDQLWHSAERIRDDHTNELESKMGNENLIGLKNRYYNSALATLLVKDKIRGDVVEHRARRIKINIGPIYRNPESTVGRAHFYAPFKSIGNLRVATFGFNAFVIILMTVVLYVALYFNWLGNLLNSWQLIKRRFAK